MLTILTKDIKIQGIDLDYKLKLKMSTLFNYLQDLSTEHSYELNVGRSRILEEHGVIWVLARIKVELLKHPGWGEELHVETWPDQPGKIEFERNYNIYDSNHDIVGKALSSWVLIDLNSRKLKRSSCINYEFPKVDKEKPINDQLGNIKPQGELTQVYKRAVRYSDIDLNHHLNNAKYVDYIMDCFSLDYHTKYFVKSIEVDYLREVLPSETIVFYKDSGEANNAVYIEGRIENSNVIAFKSAIEFMEI